MKNYKDRPLKIFLSYIADHKLLFIVDIVCAVLASSVEVIFPYVSRYCMNTLLPSGLYKAFFSVMAVIISAYIVRSGLYYVMIVFGHKMGVLVEADMRKDLFTHIQGLSFSFFDKNRTGKLISRITSELFDVVEIAHHGPENLIICTITIVGALAVMFTIEWRLALVLALVLPLCVWFTLTQRLKLKRANIEVKRKTADITAAVESGISGIRTAKAFANEKKEAEKFDAANEIFIGAKNKYYKSMGLFYSGLQFTTGILQVTVITVGGFLIMRGKLDYIDLVTFALYVSTFTAPLKILITFAEQYLQGTAGFMRFLEIMRTEPEITDAPDAVELTDAHGEIEYKDVSFEYGNGVPVLSHIDLKIEPGKCLAIVGPSGGGKTTLCQLLPRFYDVCSGSISVDGRDIREYTQESLHRSIGIIQQDVFLFAGTVRDNILYGRPDATEEEVIEAAKRAEIHEDIMLLPDGYDTFVGERGVMLSGGQKQRISIARVFLKNPRILILDEATSALDTITEQKIQSSLDELCRGRTTVIIAHRLSTISNADCIAVIDGEKLIEQGSHEELMEQNGEYAGLVRAQTINRGE